MTVKMNLFCGGKFWKATFVCRMLPQGLLFLINRHFWKFQTCPFWKKYAFPYIWAYLVPIGPYLVPIGPYLIPIGPYLALLGLIWPWQLNKSVTQKVPTEDTEPLLPKLFQGLEDTNCIRKPPGSFLSDQIWTKWSFLKMGMSKK